jgi:hypothetical protein
MSRFNRVTRALWVLGATGACVMACKGKAPLPVVEDSAPDGLDWSDRAPTFLVDAVTATPYEGKDSAVLEAQERLPTGSELHAEVVLRSCGPLGGVCHNKKEYPDMRTPSNFVGLIGSPCNVQSGSPEGVFDLCERTGDQIRFDGDSNNYEIGWIEVIPGEPTEEIGPDMPGLHIHLGQAVSEGQLEGRWTSARFLRSFVDQGEVDELSYAIYTGVFYRLDGGTHIVAEVPDYRSEDVDELIGAGVEQGDLNRNGIFGARPNEKGEVLGPVSLIKAGDPESSYIVARMRGHMGDQDVPGSRMPLANSPFSVAEMIALFCFIEGLPADGKVNLESDIDYKNCSYSDPATHPALAVEGAGKNWSDRISPLLEANCGGCHSSDRAEGDLILIGDDVYDYLQETVSVTDPKQRKFVVPGDPQNSYLFLKVIGEDSIEGKQMPLDPLEGVRTLSPEEIADIEDWITDGAAP